MIGHTAPHHTQKSISDVNQTIRYLTWIPINVANGMMFSELSWVSMRVSIRTQYQGGVALVSRLPSKPTQATIKLTTSWSRSDPYTTVILEHDTLYKNHKIRLLKHQHSVTWNRGGNHAGIPWRCANDVIRKWSVSKSSNVIPWKDWHATRCLLILKESKWHPLSIQIAWKPSYDHESWHTTTSRPPLVGGGLSQCHQIKTKLSVP